MNRSNTPNGSGFARVGKQHPCPICNKADWCGISRDGAFAICMRMDCGAIRQTANGGYLHKLDSSLADSLQLRHTIERCNRQQDDTSNWPTLAVTFQVQVKSDWLQRLSRELGVSVKNLKRLGVGWSPRNRAWSFPMRHAAGQVCGIRLRNWAGRKWAIRGSRQGLFIPERFPQTLKRSRLFIAEGPTDTAALLDMSFNAIGRPSCRGMERQIVQLAKQTAAAQVVIAADRDKPGRDGAAQLAAILIQAGIANQVFIPPPGEKDIRQWRQSGANASDVIRLLSSKSGGAL